MRSVALALALVTVLAGCLGSADEAPADPSAGADAPGEADGASPADATLNATSPDDMTGGHAPHIHNYWGESDRVTIFDGDVDVQVLDRSTFFSLFLERRAAAGGAFFELPEGATVYEGTGQLSITPTWTDPTITGVALRYHSPDMPSSFTAWSDWAQLAPGTPLVVDVTPAMTDMPHDAKSRWSFQLAAGGSAGLAQGAVHLVVEVVRMRDVMAFPGHPDTYEDTDRYVLADEAVRFSGSNRFLFLAQLATGSFASDAWYPPKGVPMETRALLLTVKLTGGGTSSPLAEQTGITALYTSAETRGDRPMQLVNQSGDTWVFGVGVDDTMVDTPYREGSAWHFHVRPVQEFEVPLPVGDGDCSGCVDYDIETHLTLVAYAVDPTGGSIDPPPEGPGR